MSTLYLFADVVIAGLGLYFVNRFLSKTNFGRENKRLPLPPGPKALPLLGNLFDLPPADQQEWLHWAKHKPLYGPLSSVSVFGQTIVLIHEQQIALALFEKRSAIYSDRPRLVFSGEMVGWANAMALAHYSPRLRAYRRRIHQFMGCKGALTRFHPLIEEETRRTLVRIVEEPEQLVSHIRTQAGAIILKMAYGYTIERSYRGARDPLVDLADEALIQFSLAAQPGAWLVDVLPILRKVPSWFPGAGFKRTGKRWKKCLTELVEKPHAFAKNQLASLAAYAGPGIGKESPSYTSALLKKLDSAHINAGSPATQADRDEEDFIIKWSAVSLYSGGADTTVSINCSFFLAMTLYPDVFARGQAEVDAVLGNGGYGCVRLPTFEDRPRLRYVDAIVKEVLRWNPVAPLSIPRVATEDDVYDGYAIPKGTMLIANIWQFTHNPNVYNDPFEFKPERFLGENPDPDSHELCFGYGRRICPGIDLADATIFMFVATCLAVLDIRKARDEQGREVTPEVRYSAGLISHPAKFECAVAPRGKRGLTLVKQIEEEHPFEKGDADALAKVRWEMEGQATA